jgi:hypothetical protein
MNSYRDEVSVGEHRENGGTQKTPNAGARYATAWHEADKSGRSRSELANTTTALNEFF